MQLNHNKENPKVLDKSTDNNIVLEKNPKVMYNKDVPRGGSMRPQLTARSQVIMQLFLERHIFESQAQVVEEALELLLENQLQKESQESHGSALGEEFLDAQNEVLGK